MKVVDWKAAFEALVQYVSPIEVAAGLVEDLVTKHTREVPEGLATRLLGTVEMYRTETRGRGITSEFIGEDATPEACAALDADAEAMRVRREVEQSGYFDGSEILFRPSNGWFRVRLGLELVAWRYEAANIDDAYRAAYDVLRRAGKLP
jgi:hypothetical protein